ncbi:MAG: DUF5668 domain-containing protein [Oscillospiraceae bacterium]|jgi:uncharacterized membrane protein HdeD (DUF308 family)|nr:DUF5668 domain-containing protein [Oscillospiraceae bacterium]
MKSKHIGVLTLGVTLVVFGLLFLLRQFFPSMDYIAVLHYWPVALILLGIEILFSALVKQKDGAQRPKVDGLSVFLLFLVLGFSAVMAALEYAVTLLPGLTEKLQEHLFG